MLDHLCDDLNGGSRNGLLDDSLGVRTTRPFASRLVDAADRKLVKESERGVLLFTPPFDQSRPDPGYIMGYPPGIRENGGLCTHGSLWTAMVWARGGSHNVVVQVRAAPQSAVFQTAPLRRT
jgi:hypothetical protein